MSTRSTTGILHTESAEVGSGVYVHSDGYPEGRLPVLKEIILRDGVDKVIKTILSATTGGWSYLDTRYTANYLGDRGELVPGYGLKYTDQQSDPKNRIKHSDFVGDSWLEFAYYIDPLTGDIHWYESGSNEVHIERFEEYSKVAAQ